MASRLSRVAQTRADTPLSATIRFAKSSIERSFGSVLDIRATSHPASDSVLKISFSKVLQKTMLPAPIIAILWAIGFLVELPSYGIIIRALRAEYGAMRPTVLLCDVSWYPAYL